MAASTVRLAIGLAIIACALATLTEDALAQFTIVRWTVDGGGSQSATGGSFSLSGTTGQFDAGFSSGGSFELRGGFWGTQTPVVSGAPGPDEPGQDGTPAVTYQLRSFSPQPNPVLSNTSIRFELPETQRASITVYNVDGTLVRALVGGNLPAGPNEVVWDARDGFGRRVSSGTYFVRVHLGEASYNYRLAVVR